MFFAVEKFIDNLGRIVVPKNMRDYYGILSNEKVILIPTNEGILMKKANEKTEPRKSRISEL